MDADRPIKVMIVDDHAVVRSGLRRILDAEDDLEVVGEASTVKEAVALSDGGSMRLWLILCK